MALNLTNLQRIGGGGPQLWLYPTTDAVATVTASGYFNLATSMLRQFDVILVVSSTGATPVLDPHIITSATGAAVVTSSIAET